MSLKHFSKEQLKDLSLIEMAYEYLKDSKQLINFHDLVSEVEKADGITHKEMKSRLAQFYTDINIDGRFLSLGGNRWGLRVWYPVDQAEEEVVAVPKPKKKKAKKVVDEEELEVEDFDDLDEEDFDDLDDFTDDDDDDLVDDDDEIPDDLDEVDVDAVVAVIPEEEFALDDEEDLDEELDEEDELVEEEDK